MNLHTFLYSGIDKINWIENCKLDNQNHRAPKGEYFA